MNRLETEIHLQTTNSDTTAPPPPPPPPRDAMKTSRTMKMSMSRLRSLRERVIRGALATTTNCLFVLMVVFLLLCGGRGIIHEVSGQSLQPSLISNQRDFADDVLRSLYYDNGDDGDGNECSSMLGLSMVFGLLYPSAIGESRTEMQQVFGFPASTTATPGSSSSNLQQQQQQQLVWSDTQNSLQERMNGNCSHSVLDPNTQEMTCLQGEPRIEIANVVWVPRQQGVNGGGSGSGGLNETYQQVVGSLVQEMDFMDATAGRRVNRWVNDATNGLIPSIVNDGPLSDNLALLAVNTIYLKAQWSKPFESRYTNMDQFYTTPARTTPVAAAAFNSHFMHQVDFFDYSETALAGYQLVKLPFSQTGIDQLSMVLALPLQEEGGRMIPPSTQHLWNAMSQLESTRMALALPRFHFVSRYGSILQRTLQNLGLRAPFIKGDLCIFQNNNNDNNNNNNNDASSCDEPRLGRVLQKTVIKVFEEGVEAAAASAVFGAISVPTEQPVLFQADHPFFFFILDEASEVIIFEGRVGDPGIGLNNDDAPAPQLAAVHQDVDFWTNTFPILSDPPRQPEVPSILGPIAMQDLGELPPPTIVSTELTSNQRVFADDLVSRIYTNDNECSSALGISMAHSLVYPAAIGDSLTQMATTLRYPPSETNLQLLWSDTQASIQSTYDGACRGYEDVEETICASSSPLVNIGNAVFVPSQAGLNSTYEQVVGDFVFAIDFEADDAGNIVNAWVSNATNGLIDSIVEDGPLSPLVLIAINVIYLKAFWAVPFSVSDTNEDAFYTSVARSEEVSSNTHFMHQVEYFDYSHAALPGYQLLGQPFNDDGLSMYFALPMSNDVPMVTFEDLFAAIPRLNLTRVAIALPRFQFESEYEEILMESLQAMGMQAPFLGDLCIQNDGSCDVSISRVAQKTFISLVEEGVEASAVTSLSGITSMPQGDTPVLFQADHPFQFFIYDDTHQVVIFEGRVGDPGVVADAATPELTTTHDDADFWSLFGVDPSIPSPPEVLEQPSVTNASSTDLKSSQRVFADGLVPLIYTNENECSSALGISMAHSLVYPSAIDQSLIDMATTLGYPQSETNLQLLWNNTQSRIQEAYKGDCIWYMDEEEAICGANASIVNIGNAVFVPSQAGLNSTYEQVVGDYVLEINFDADDAGSRVNEWVSAATNGLIESIVEDGPLSPLVLLAVNTIYLKGSWQNTFSASATNEDTFYTSVSRSEALTDMAHFMHQVDFFDYSDKANPEYQLLKQPFNDERLSMFFALPTGENVSMMSSEDFIAALTQLSRTRVAIALPKFQFESEYEEILMDSLQAMGMEAPFSGGLCIQDGLCDAYISLVIQKTFIAMDENGVEAAAASVVGANRNKPTDTPVLFQADHPFQFFIYDEDEQVIIFEGRVGNPGIAEDSAAPQLTATHADADFWSSNFGVDLSGESSTFDPPVSIIADLATNQRAFADDLVPRIYTYDNECSSALGISMAHSLVYPAAIDQSLVDMTTTLRYPPSETNLQLLWNDTQNRIQETYNGECNYYEDAEETVCASNSPLVTISNAVFVPNQTDLNSTYEQVVGDFVFTIDFEADDAGSIVNAWVNASTNGLIDSIVDDGPLSPQVLLAINVIYLKAAWAVPFMISSTNEDTFYTSVARTEALASKTHFMHQVDYFDYSHEAIPDYQLLRQPFTEKGLSMYFALPMTSSNVPMMLTSEDLFAALPQLNQTRVAIALPKFQFESEYEEILMESLQAMGMVAPFLGGLCIQDGSCETSISRVAQKTFIHADEEGVEAAAVTLVAGTVSVPTETPVLFQADHPFQFFIYDEDEQVFIFEGRVGDPGVIDEAATPQLTATHDDADFWTNNFGVDPSTPVVSAAPPEVLEQPSTGASNTTTTTPDDEETAPGGNTDSNNTDLQPNAPDEQTSSSALDNHQFQTTVALLVASFIGGYWWLA